MREIVLDTETTGLDPESGDRIVEIGAVELRNHMPTGQTWHQYINPERDVPQEAVDVHGLTIDFLSDKPVFSQVAQAFLEFIGDAKLVIHNAAFDMKFLNAELRWLGLRQLPYDRAVDTLEIARRKFPGSPASLDALCRRYGIDNSARTLHGALLDSEILADVYLELIGGRQPDLVLSTEDRTTSVDFKGDAWKPMARPAPLPSRITEAELAAHKAFVDAIGEKSLWSRFSSPVPEPAAAE
jgi:DNA polymerase-3 subunit epsilon